MYENTAKSFVLKTSGIVLKRRDNFKLMKVLYTDILKLALLEKNVDKE